MLFDKFNGIHAEREIRVQEKNSLEHLIQVGDRVVKEYLHRLEQEDGEGDEAAFAKMMHENCALLEKELEKVKFTEEDLRSYILTKANTEETTGKVTGLLSAMYGMYTSILLESLTNRNKEEGKRTRFYVNGQGSRFDMLFGFARKIDSLYVENFTSDGIGGMAGWMGNINILIAKDIKGDALFGDLAEYKGKINLIIAKNIDGDALLEIDGNSPVNDSDEGCDIGLIIAENVKGESCFKKIGRHGKVGMIIAKNIEGKDVLNDLAINTGRIGVVAGIDISAELSVFCNAGWQET
ncbi:hypothetical protein KY325_04040, partial [Candidatus Woesearchaeota archaeon]|nr:hypothetical protein [Candidatus Woesearchaeota archaeon]